jgi:hypothetical protein
MYMQTYCPSPMAQDHVSSRPIQISLCYQAALDGDLNKVKEQVQQLLHAPNSWQADKPTPAWFFESLSAAIQRNDVEIVRYLVDVGVAEGSLPGEIAVRSEAFGILELFLQRGWDINEPMARHEPPVLRLRLFLFIHVHGSHSPASHFAPTTRR